MQRRRRAHCRTRGLASATPCRRDALLELSLAMRLESATVSASIETLRRDRAVFGADHTSSLSTTVSERLICDAADFEIDVGPTQAERLAAAHPGRASSRHAGGGDHPRRGEERAHVVGRPGRAAPGARARAASPARPRCAAPDRSARHRRASGATRCARCAPSSAQAHRRSDALRSSDAYNSSMSRGRSSCSFT